MNLYSRPIGMDEGNIYNHIRPFKLHIHAASNRLGFLGTCPAVNSQTITHHSHTHNVK